MLRLPQEPGSPGRFQNALSVLLPEVLCTPPDRFHGKPSSRSPRERHRHQLTPAEQHGAARGGRLRSRTKRDSVLSPPPGCSFPRGQTSSAASPPPPAPDGCRGSGGPTAAPAALRHERLRERRRGAGPAPPRPSGDPRGAAVPSVQPSPARYLRAAARRGRPRSGEALAALRAPAGPAPPTWRPAAVARDHRRPRSPVAILSAQLRSGACALRSLRARREGAGSPGPALTGKPRSAGAGCGAGGDCRSAVALRRWGWVRVVLGPG